MKVNPVPNDPAGLVAFAQAMAAVLSERSDEFGIVSSSGYGLKRSK